VGCYSTYGLAGYSSQDGQEVWRRKDLKQVQDVTVSELEDWVFCGRESGAAHLVKASTGENLETLTGVKAVFPSPFDRTVIVAARNLELHSPLGTRLGGVKRAGKFLKTCAFSHSEFIVSEEDSIRCFDLKSQGLLWAHPLGADAFFPCIVFQEDSGCFIGLESHTQFVSFEARTGRICRRVMPVRAPGMMARFCHRGTELLTIGLLLFSTETGAVVQDLATPELLAWDPEARMQRLRALAESGRSFEELHRYVEAEGFSKGDASRVLLMKADYDRRQKET
jgi:hypothetical protein